MKKKNKYDAFMKVKKTIESCKTYGHYITALKMKNLFKDMYNDYFLDDVLFSIALKKQDEL